MQAVNSQWPPRSIVQINLDPRDHAATKPADRSVDLIADANPFHWQNAAYASQCKHWYPPGIVYNPLYFEDPRLERNGQQVFGGTWLESARGAVRLYGQGLALPYNLLVARPKSCEYPPSTNRCGAASLDRQPIFYRQ